MLYVCRGEQQVAGSGFGGPGLHPDSVINEWRGQTDELPFFVMARVSPRVDRVIATTAQGTEMVLPLSPPDGDEIALTGRYDEGSEPGRLVMTVPGDVVTAITLASAPDDTTQIGYSFDVSRAPASMA